MTYNHIPQILENRPEIAVKLITLEQVEKAIKHSDRAIIPVVGDCMEAAGIMDGKAGAAGYPKDPAAEIAEYEAQRGPMSSDWGRRFTAAFIRCLNVSYAQGRRWPMGRKSQIKGRRAGACPYPSEPRVPGRGWPGAELWGGAGPIRPPRDTYRVQEGGGAAAV